MKIEYIQPFVQATENAFREVVGINVTPMRPYVFKGSEDMLEVSALIGLAGETAGAVILSFPEQSSINFSEKFTGIKSAQVDDVVCDAIGELVNIVAGNAKEGLLEFRIYISLPKVVMGQGSLKLPGNIPTITVPFKSERGDFHLIVALKEEEKKGKPA